MIRRLNFALLFLLLGSITVQASEIVEVKPLTNQILMIRFDDGYVVHHKRGQRRSDEVVIIVPLDGVKASLTSSYTVISADDGAYASALNPTDVGRKSKPTEFAMLCQTYDNGCINTDPDRALEHWIYLFLPHPMKTGSTYTVNLDGLSEAENTIDFVYRESALHSEAIHVNNIGYSTDAPEKYGYLYHWMGDKGGLDLSSFEDEPFHLFDIEKEEVVFTGAIVFRKGMSNKETGQTSDTPDGNFGGADVYECDFSDFNTPGNYKLVVPGMGSSFPFSLGDDPYREAFYWTMKGLYHNRSGIALTEPYTSFTRPAPHHVKTTPGFSGRLKYSSFRSSDLSSNDGAAVDKAGIEAAEKGILENTYGWYQDAGDWDGYYTHSHIPAYLFFLYEAGPSKFTDGELNIPESGNSIPDILDEATWLLRYFKRAKDEIESKGWGTGGVPGARVFGDLWGPDTGPDDVGQGSWEDVNRDWYVLGEDPWTSFKYAALTAQLAYIFDEGGWIDPEGVDWKQESIDAYAWAKLNIRAGDEAGIKQVRMYSSAALFRLTGDEAYHEQFRTDLMSVEGGAVDQTKLDEMFGVWMYLLCDNQARNAQSLNKVKILVSGGAERYLLQSAESRACRWGGDLFFPMLVGQGTTPMVTAGVYGYLLNKDTSVGNRYYTYLHTTADYFLGTNPLNMTWISGVAERSPVGIFHLDWWYRDKSDPNNSFPVQPGIVPYGQWRVEDLGPLGWWNPNWAYQNKSGEPQVYPGDISVWPGHERWFESRVSPLLSEFTVHQNTVVAAFVYGFLTKGASRNISDGVVTGLERSFRDDYDVRVFPNPSTGSAFIRSESARIASISVYDAMGNNVFTSGFLDTQEHTLDLTRYPAGSYIVKVILKNRLNAERKLVVVK